MAWHNDGALASKSNGVKIVNAVAIASLKRRNCVCFLAAAQDPDLRVWDRGGVKAFASQELGKEEEAQFRATGDRVVHVF